MLVMNLTQKDRSLKIDAVELRAIFGERLQTDVPLARYTSARAGGTADLLLMVETVDELANTAQKLWQTAQPFRILGGGSNILISDAGMRELVLLNRARQIRFDEDADPPIVRVGSGANFGLLARQAAARGLAGLEWAAGIPGTVGGAVFGNAGAHGDDVAGCLRMAEILLPETGREIWPQKQFAFEYRSSILKRENRAAVIISAVFELENSTPQAVNAKMERFKAYRRKTQPPGASMGSMFKNPPGDYAGRLIEQAGLKGQQVGDAQISNLHANFFVNRGEASAADIFSLIQLAREAVAEKFGVDLELEIELVGEWENTDG